MIDKEKSKIIYDITPKRDKVMFSRKLEELNQLLEVIRTYEDRISEIMIEKQVHMDKLQALRISMVKLCVHPTEFLTEVENHIFCKFCEKRLQLHAKKHQ